MLITVPMWLQIVDFVLEVLFTLVGGACFLLFYMRLLHMNALHPLGQMALGLSNWLRQPIKRVLPQSRTLDWASLLVMLLLELGQEALWVAVMGSSWALWPLLGLLGALKLVCSVLTAVLVLAVLGSWVQLKPWLAGVAEQLSAPLLAPLRRVLPTPGGLDLSPLLMVLVLQLISYMLGQFKWRVLMAGTLT